MFDVGKKESMLVWSFFSFVLFCLICSCLHPRVAVAVSTGASTPWHALTAPPPACPPSPTGVAWVGPTVRWGEGALTTPAHPHTDRTPSPLMALTMPSCRSGPLVSNLEQFYIRYKLRNEWLLFSFVRWKLVISFFAKWFYADNSANIKWFNISKVLILMKKLLTVKRFFEAMGSAELKNFEEVVFNLPSRFRKVPLDDSCALDSCGCYGLYYLDLGTYSAPDHVRVYPGYILVLESGNNKVYYNRDVNSTDTVYLVRNRWWITWVNYLIEDTTFDLRRQSLAHIYQSRLWWNEHKIH